MTTLPATYLEAEAVDFARQHIAYVRDGKLKLWGVASGEWFEKGDSQRACSIAMAEWALEDATNLMQAVAFARAGFELWEDCLRDLILNFQNRRQELPTYLAAFAMDLTRGDLTWGKVPKQSGRRRSTDAVRNL